MAQLAAPVYIPKVYNGKNKTFFFFNLERYRDREALYNGITTMPNSQYLSGRPRQQSAGHRQPEPRHRLCGAGRSIQNAIYDPNTATIDSSGRRVLQVTNNIIRKNRFDPVSVKVMSFATSRGRPRQ